MLNDLRLKVLAAVTAIAIAASFTQQIDSRPVIAAPRVQMTTFPRSARQHNWTGPRGDWDGSCCYAALTAILLLEGYDDEAAFVRSSYCSGASWPGVEEALQSVGVPFTHTVNGDASFLLKTCSRGRCCVIGVYSGFATVPYAAYAKGCGHAVVLFHYDGQMAGIYDSNHEMGAIRWVTCKQLLHDWQRWAVAPLPKTSNLGD